MEVGKKYRVTRLMADSQDRIVLIPGDEVTFLYMPEQLSDYSFDNVVLEHDNKRGIFFSVSLSDLEEIKTPLEDVLNGA
jgi:hypothetical protein